jgi:hypothetical protein
MRRITPAFVPRYQLCVSKPSPHLDVYLNFVQLTCQLRGREHRLRTVGGTLVESVIGVQEIGSER